ncbi:hypothetical protein ALI22I_44610 [Saccharothrix sp. ALI-22-I]|nr:hypothetical protein ALI22I_44610 [Saccharothrix sp. ALI-22-I]
MLAGLLSDWFGEAVFLQGQAARLQLLDLVRQCCKRPNGLAALVEGVTALDPHTPELSELVLLGDEWAAARALPTRDWDKLRQALRSVRLTDDPGAERRRLRHLARVATDGKCDDLPAHCGSAWSAFLHLADLNAGPNALPPAMVFIACLADQVEDKALAEEFLRWNWRWAERFEVTDLVEHAHWRARSAPRDGAEVVYLVFEVDPDPADQHKVVLSHWRQWDAPGWNAQRRGDVTVRRDELEREIDRVIAGLEADLGVRAEGVRVGAIFVEFVLPWDMLNTPVQYWRKATMSTDAVPLAVDHPVVLRSLERMRNQRFLLAWKKRWSAVAGRSASTLPYWGQANGGWDPTRMAIDLGADDSIVSLVLSEPPGDRGGRAWHEAAMAFRAGIPVILWDHEDCSTTGFHDAVTALFADGAVDQLPHRVARLRREALRSNASDVTHAGHGIAVLWDDADRLPEPLGAWWGSLGGSE